MTRRPDPSASRPVPSLTRQRVSADAELLYRHLVRSGPETTGALVEALGLTGRRVVLALDELIDIGAVANQGRTRRSGGSWTARSPQRGTRTSYA
nr:hypothetical protein [Micromonospora sp. DSM 115978]